MVLLFFICSAIVFSTFWVLTGVSIQRYGKTESSILSVSVCSYSNRITKTVIETLNHFLSWLTTGVIVEHVLFQKMDEKGKHFAF